MRKIRTVVRRSYFRSRKLYRLARGVARRRYRFARADVVLVSYPKSGRTWLRVMVARCLDRHLELGSDELLDLERLHDLDPRVPRILVTHDDSPHKKLPEQVERDKRRYRAKRVVLLVRDPRDVVVSAYFEASRRRGTFEGSLGDFVFEPLGGIDTILMFYRAWAQATPQLSDILVVRYEDLRSDTERELGRVLSFLGFEDIAAQTITDAVSFGAFENMQRLEREQKLDSFRLRAAEPEDPESFKVRRGKVGGFRDYLHDGQIRAITRRLAPFEDVFGYR